MKRSILFLLLATAFSTLPASAQTPRVAASRDVGASASSTAAIKLPTTRPGSYIAGTRPLIPPPPAGFPALMLPPAYGDSPAFQGSALPAAVNTPKASSKALPDPGSDKQDTTRATVPASQDAEARAPTSSTQGKVVPGVDIGPDAAVPAPAARRKPSTVFLSRETLQKSRDKCTVQLKSPELLKFSTQGGDRVIKLAVIGGRSCVKAISGSHAWMTVSAMGNNDEVTVTVLENEEPDAREGNIVIANTGSSVQIKIYQDANTSGFRRIEL
jgi:hypothetical protein